MRCGLFTPYAVVVLQIEVDALWTKMPEILQFISDHPQYCYVLPFDEIEEMVSALSHERGSDRQKAFVNLIRNTSVACLIGVSATPLQWLLLMQFLGRRIDAGVKADLHKLRRQGYSWIKDTMQPLTRPTDGAPVYIPEAPKNPGSYNERKWRTMAEYERDPEVVAWKNYQFQDANMYGIDSEEVRFLFESFNACPAGDAEMLLSLGHRVKERGFRDQVQKIFGNWSEESVALVEDLTQTAAIVIADQKTEVFTYPRCEFYQLEVSLTDKRKLRDLEDVHTRLWDEGYRRFVYLGQASVDRGISFPCAFSHLAGYATPGIDKQRWGQFLGRASGKGKNRPVVTLLRKAVSDWIPHDYEFQEECLSLAIQGKQIPVADELIQTAFAAYVDSSQPICRAMSAMPHVARMINARAREEEREERARNAVIRRRLNPPAPQLPPVQQPALREPGPSQQPALQRPVPQLPPVQQPALREPEPAPRPAARQPRAVPARMDAAQAVSALLRIPEGSVVRVMANGKPHYVGRDNCVYGPGGTWGSVRQWAKVMWDQRRERLQKQTRDHGINLGQNVFIGEGSNKKCLDAWARLAA